MIHAPPSVAVPQQLFAAMGSKEFATLPHLRIGVFWEWFEDADPEVVAACKAAVASLQAKLGCQVRCTAVSMQCHMLMIANCSHNMLALLRLPGSI